VIEVLLALILLALATGPLFPVVVTCFVGFAFVYLVCEGIKAKLKKGATRKGKK
jgi:hypothetical protein